MKAWQIFEHAVRMLIRNISVAARISLAPAGLLLVMAILFGSAATAVLDPMADPEALGGAMGAAGVLFILVSGISWLWIVVNWHRFVLLEETPSSWIAPMRVGRMAAYFFTILAMYVGLTLVMIVVLMPIAFLSGGAEWLMVLVALAAVTYLGIVFGRLSVLLPAAAVGRRLGVSEAWNATRGSSGTLVMLFLFFLVANFLLAIPILLLSLIPVIGILGQVIFQWGIMLIGASLLTTLYGHYVEKRDLVV